MTLGLDQWLRLYGYFSARRVTPCNIPQLNLSRLADRDIADLNLPHDIASQLNGRHADERRRRMWR